MSGVERYWVARPYFVGDPEYIIGGDVNMDAHCVVPADHYHRDDVVEIEGNTTRINMNSGVLTSRPDLLIVMDPIIRTSTQELGMKGWKLAAKQTRLGQSSWSSPKIRFYNDKTFFTVRIQGGKNRNVLANPATLWQEIRDNGYLGGMRVSDTSAMSFDDEYQAMKHRLNSRMAEAAKMRREIEAKDKTIEYLESMIDRGDYDELTILQKLNEERLARIDPKYAKTGEVIQLVVDNEAIDEEYRSFAKLRTATG